MIPVTSEQFFGVFSAYNEGIWPAQLGLVLLAVVACWAAVRARLSSAGRVVMGILAVLWLWTGVVYHLTYFAPVNPAAKLFGALFIVQAGLFGWEALRGGVSVRLRPDVHGVMGGLLVAYALVIYPVIGLLTGHAWMASPTFGAPCPLTIFTFGALLWVAGRVPVRLLVIPALWAIVGTSAVWAFGVVQDIALPIAAGIALLMIWRRNRWLAEAPSDSSAASIRISASAPAAPPQ